jgi:hypothetical protein
MEVGDETRCVADARSAMALGSLGRLGREAFSDLSFGESVGPRAARLLIPLGRLIPMPTSPPTSVSHSKLTENAMSTNHIPSHDTRLRQQAEETAKLASLPVRHEHAAGIDVGDHSHWVCVEHTPDGSDTTREFPAHTPGLRDLMAWLKSCGVTTVALEASGAYGHVLFLTLLEAGWNVLITSPKFTRQIQGRPKTDRLDCQWIQRLHQYGLLPSIFQPDDATQTLRDFVRQRANLVRLSGHHIQRLQKALELMNLKLTNVMEDVTGVTGLKIIRAIIAGERDPRKLGASPSSTMLGSLGPFTAEQPCKSGRSQTVNRRFRADMQLPPNAERIHACRRVIT